MRSTHTNILLKGSLLITLTLMMLTAIVLAACGEQMVNVAMPLPTVTPMPGYSDPSLEPPTPTSAPPPAVQEQHSMRAAVQVVTPVAVDAVQVEGIIEQVLAKDNLVVLVVNKEHYTIIPEITARIGKWFKVGNKIKMTGMRYNDSTIIIGKVINVFPSAAALSGHP